MKIFKMVSVLSLSVLATACGNMASTGNSMKTTTYASYSSESSNTHFLTAAQSCSENPNVVSPQYPYAIQTQYHACKGVQGATVSVQIFTPDHSSKNVCIFATRTVNGSIAPFVINPYAPAQNRYAVQCTTAQASGSAVSFGSLSVSGIFVVDQTNAPAFAQCLAYGDVSSCTASGGYTYSYGSL